VSKVTVAMMCVMFIAVTLVCGCATGPKGPTDEELITSTMNGIKEATLAKDIDKIMSYLSEDFYHPEVGDKDSMQDLAEQGLDMIDMSTVEVNLDDMEITIDGEEAEVYPVDASASLGSVTVSITLQKDDDGAWRITGGDAEGI